MESETLEWPDDEERIDIIGQNGGDGEHYTGHTTLDDDEC